jgi:hypothetical protein
MEDLLTWADTVAPYALRGAGIDDRIMRMWGHLRAAMFFMRFQPGQHTEVSIAEAQEDLFQYAPLVQDAFGTSELMTFQLHTVMAHAAEQARACGPTAHAGEWWLEHLMQMFKRVTKYRSTCHPECTGFNHLITLNALMRNAAAHPGIRRLYEAATATKRASVLAEGQYDDTAGGSG